MNIFTNKIIDLFTKYDYPIKDALLFTSGLNILGRYILFGLTTFIISFILNAKAYILLFDFFLIILRRKIGGIHTSNPFTCFFISVFTFTIIPYYFYCITINQNIIFFITCIELIILFFLHPCKSNNIKYGDDFYRKMNFQKKIILILYFLLILINIKANTIITDLICYSLLINLISIIMAHFQYYYKKGE